MIISISGTPGAGKGTLAKNLAAELGWPVFSMGDLRRQAAARRGMTLAEYNKLGETDPEPTCPLIVTSGNWRRRVIISSLTDALPGILFPGQLKFF